MNSAVRIRRTCMVLAIAAPYFVPGPLNAPLAFAQLAGAPRNSPEFDVASINPIRLDADYNPREIVPRAEDPLRFRARAQASRLIEWAFDLRDFQIAGGPAWIRDGSTRYEILAAASQPSTEPQMKQMLRALLAGRFGLKWRSERREMPVYFLSADRQGPKLAAAKVQPRNGDGAMDIGKGEFLGRGVAMSRLVQVLTENMDRPVIDRTGLAGRYDFDLRFDPSSLIDWRLAPVIPSLMRDLGLRLEPGKAEIEILRIDAIERPSDN